MLTKPGIPPGMGYLSSLLTATLLRSPETVNDVPIWRMAFVGAYRSCIISDRSL